MLSYIFDNDDVYLDWTDIIISIFLFAFSLWFFYGMLSRQYDMGFHLNAICTSTFYSGDFWGGLFKISYSMFFKLFVVIFSLLKIDFTYFSMPCVLALCFTLKFLFFRLASIDYLSKNYKINPHKVVYSFLILMLCFAGQLNFIPQILARYSTHLSRLSIYHNPTTVAVMPFAFALFYFSTKDLSVKNCFLIVFFFFINLFIKQSFILIWAPSFFVFRSFFYFDNNNRLNIKINYKFLLFSIFGSILILLLLFMIKSTTTTLKDGIIFSFPYALRTHMSGCGFSNNFSILLESIIGVSFSSNSQLLSYVLFIAIYFPLLLISAILFPICVFSFLKKINQSRILVFSWFLFFFSYGVSFFVTQAYMPRNFNFSWQISICNSILFFSSLVFLLDNFKFSWVNILVMTIFGIHVYQGFVYILNIIFKGGVLS